MHRFESHPPPPKKPSSDGTGPVQDAERKRIFWVRFFVLLCLVVTAVCIGYGFYLILSYQQSKAQQDQYYALARKIESSTINSVHSKKDAMLLAASMMLHFCPNATMWPNCNIPYGVLSSLATPLNRMSLIRSLSVATMVLPSQLSDFEAFAQEFYAKSNRQVSGETLYSMLSQV